MGTILELSLAYDHDCASILATVTLRRHRVIAPIYLYYASSWPTGERAHCKVKKSQHYN